MNSVTQLPRRQHCSIAVQSLHQMHHWHLLLYPLKPSGMSPNMHWGAHDVQSQLELITHLMPRREGSKWL